MVVVKETSKEKLVVKDEKSDLVYKIEESLINIIKEQKKIDIKILIEKIMKIFENNEISLKVIKERIDSIIEREKIVRNENNRKEIMINE
jgi:hypothetical protein